MSTSLLFILIVDWHQNNWHQLPMKWLNFFPIKLYFAQSNIDSIKWILIKCLSLYKKRRKMSWLFWHVKYVRLGTKVKWQFITINNTLNFNVRSFVHLLDPPPPPPLPLRRHIYNILCCHEVQTLYQARSL